MQPQFPPHQPPPVPGPWQAQPGYSPAPQYAQQPYGNPAFGPPFPPPARRGNGTVWALVGGGAVLVVVLVIAVLAATGAFRSGPPHYTEAQAVAHVHATALSAEVRGASDARIVRALHSVCDGLSGGKTTVTRLLTTASSQGGTDAQDGLMLVGTAIATYCPSYYGEAAAWRATH